jgi:fructokinase
MLGEILADTLTASKVDTRYLARSDRPTTVAFVKLVNGQATYAFYDEGTAGRMLSTASCPTCRPASRRCSSAGSAW